MHKTAVKLFKKANNSDFERLDLKLDAREMKFFFSEQYIYRLKLSSLKTNFICCGLSKNIV